MSSLLGELKGLNKVHIHICIRIPRPKHPGVKIRAAETKHAGNNISKSVIPVFDLIQHANNIYSAKSRD